MLNGKRRRRVVGVGWPRRQRKLWSLQPITALLAEIEKQGGNAARAASLVEEARTPAEKISRELSGGKAVG